MCDTGWSSEAAWSKEPAPPHAKELAGVMPLRLLYWRLSRQAWLVGRLPGSLLEEFYISSGLGEPWYSPVGTIRCCQGIRPVGYQWPRAEAKVFRRGKGEGCDDVGV